MQSAVFHLCLSAPGPSEANLSREKFASGLLEKFSTNLASGIATSDRQPSEYWRDCLMDAKAFQNAIQLLLNFLKN